MAKRKGGEGQGNPGRENEIKWRTLKHKGPQFHPPYKRLGAKVFKYNNRFQRLSKSSEEVVVMYSKYLMRKNRQKKVPKLIKRNFFEDWKKMYMTPRESKTISRFTLCDFTLVVNHLASLGEKKKNVNKKQREKEREMKERQKRKFQHVFINGKRERINNFMVEPPGLYFGRGDNKNVGKIKARIEPEDVTINCDVRCRPRPPQGRHWHAIVHDQTKSWLACYKDPITNKMKYIFPHASSEIQSQSEQEKYDKAEELTAEIMRIRRKYQKHLRSESLETRQHATAVYLLDQLALRVGNEKTAGEADTVGCCTLRVQHLRLLQPARRRMIRLNFNGKDSVPYDRQIIVSHTVYQNLSEFLHGKTRAQLIFHEISSKSLNDYLAEMMEGLTAKVFRTFKATECYKRKLEQLSSNLGQDSTDKEKQMMHLKANLEVAKLLNHVTMIGNTKKAKQKGLKRLKDKVVLTKAEIRKIDRRRPKPGSDDFDKREKAKRELKNMEDELQMKEASVKWALRTSLANYIDPRSVKYWCEYFNLDIKHVYTKTLQDKFRWALAGRPTTVPTGNNERINRLQIE